MNMPGFTAEATFYNSVASYRSSFLFQPGIGVNVTPQLQPEWPRICVCSHRDDGSQTCFCDPVPIKAPFGAGPPGQGGIDKKNAARCRSNCIIHFWRNTAL